ncbi:MAG: zinc-dependent metalloprotease [Crocinitomicaceae bacterium]|nr:zinc-dependent metalloprotease [Crocinitomicaceae bacterium]
MKSILILSTFIIATSSFAQEIHRCMTPQAIDYQNSITPGFIDEVNAVFDAAKLYSENDQTKSNHLYTIPVVVHVVYNTPEQNLADSVVLDQIRVLNEDYNRLNADTVNMRPDFDIVKGSPQIEFVLAQIDPLGNPTTGITRTNTSTPSFGSLLILGGDFSDLEKVKSTVDGGEDAWDQTHYLNIWVCNMSVDFLGTEITALLGYATPPAGLPNWPPGSIPNLSDGVVIQYQAFGSNNPNVLDAGGGPIDVRGRTSCHEVGHYLGLRHIWGDGDCTEQDGIDDTPNADAQSDQDCNPLKNTCVDNIQGVDLPDMIENYMDYSSETCQNSFTQGQVDLMHGVLENERFDLVHGNPAGLDQISSIAWSIQPNPANEFVSIISEITKGTIQLYTVSGQLIESHRINSNTTTLNVQDLDAGMYIVEIVGENQARDSKRIVVE